MSAACAAGNHADLSGAVTEVYHIWGLAVWMSCLRRIGRRDTRGERPGTQELRLMGRLTEGYLGCRLAKLVCEKYQFLGRLLLSSTMLKRDTISAHSIVDGKMAQLGTKNDHEYDAILESSRILGMRPWGLNTANQRASQDCGVTGGCFIILIVTRSQVGDLATHLYNSISVDRQQWGGSPQPWCHDRRGNAISE